MATKAEGNLTLIPYPEGEYSVVLNGTGNGTYSFEFINLGLAYRKVLAQATPENQRQPSFNFRQGSKQR